MSYQTGATFIPGGDDSYFMPELIAPAPQRIMHELPTNIQDTLEGHPQRSNQGLPHQQTAPNDLFNSPPAAYPNGQQAPQYERGSGPGFPSSRNPENPQDRYGGNAAAPLYEPPNFTQFPVLKNPPLTVPPTDEQREAILEAARQAVLASSDPEVQLTWAQDALTYVDIAMQNEARVSVTQPPRSRTPRIEHVLKEDAVKVVEFLADQHHPMAEFLRGTWLEFGKFGNRVDKKEAFYCYTRASERGYARAEYRIGMQFETSNDALKAIKYYQRGADAGDSACCYRLGMMTLLGQHGQAQDYEKGLNMIYQSSLNADENAPQGAYVFGMLQSRQLAQVSIPERFLPLDVASAKINIERAAYLGFGKAQVKMGSAYELCELGCEFNPALSLHYNALAARQGEGDAEMAISKWFLCGQEGVFEKNEEMAFTYAQRAAVNGMATAQFALGYFYEVGIYVPVNFKEAKDWYAKAAANGNKDANNRVESISRSKTLSRKDHERVALPRIRQQQGSQARNSSQLAPVVEAPISPTIDMPDPAKIRLTPTPQPRPTSTAPYPTEGDPPLPRLPGQPGALLTPENRPTSAFGINPNLRPLPAVNVPYRRPDPYSQPAYPPQTRYQSNLDAYAPGYGRGGRTANTPSPGPGHRPQGRGQPQPGPQQQFLNPHRPQDAPPPRPAKLDPSKPAPPKLDQSKVNIGFSAPLDASGADRPRPNPGAWSYSKKPLPPPSGSAAPQRPNPPHSPGSGAGPGGDRYYAGKPVGNSAAPLSNIRPARITPSTAPTLPAAAPTSTKPTKVSASAQVPGKGPKTFEEIGVPQGKNNSECVVM